jgi:hypothetical protein
MKAEKIILVGLVALVLSLAGFAEANTLKFDLFTLGCPTAFSHNMNRWRTDFDLDIPVSEISHVYIDWSGTFTAGLSAYNDDPCNLIPWNTSLSANLHLENFDCFIYISGGKSTYPAPQQFAVVSPLIGGVGPPSLPFEPFFELLQFPEPKPLDKPVKHIEHGSITLNKATLIIEGTFVPEPATLFLLTLGGLPLLTSRRK